MYRTTQNHSGERRHRQHSIFTAAYLYMSAELWQPHARDDTNQHNINAQQQQQHQQHAMAVRNSGINHTRPHTPHHTAPHHITPLHTTRCRTSPNFLRRVSMQISHTRASSSDLKTTTDKPTKSDNEKKKRTTERQNKTTTMRWRRAAWGR